MDIDHSGEDVGFSPRCPVEIWLNCLSHLDLDDLKNTSLSSSFYRKIAVKLLYRSVTLRFGRWQSEEDRLDGVEDEETERYNSETSLNVLLCLTGDAGIAAAVVRLTVCAFAHGQFPLVFESYHIEQVLPKLKSLREFRWIAGYPPVHMKVMNALRKLEPGVELLLLNG